MSAPVLTMSKQEFERAVLVRKVLEKRLTQRKAAEILGLSLRQIERLCRNYRTAGPAALTSRRRGRASNHRAAASHRESVLQLVRARYADFGPTLAREKLLECHGLEVSKETLRKWMTEDGLWVPHARRRDRVQQPRNRRTCVGELIQIDGCDHEWFEERAARCTLLVYVDDATSRLMQLHFCKRCMKKRHCGATFRDADWQPWNAATALEDSYYSAAAADGTVMCPTGISSSRGLSRALVLSQ
jgi:transposase